LHDGSAEGIDILCGDHNSIIHIENEEKDELEKSFCFSSYLGTEKKTPDHPNALIK
jgi:hypothetical protein